MKKKVLAAIIIAMGILTACGGEEDVKSPIILEEEPIATSQAEDVESSVAEGETETEFKVITEREIVDGQMQSYLTGEWKDADVVQRRNMAVMIPNNTPALPQYGISKASIVYEAPVEGRITRLMGLFEDYDDMDHIGPVRSSRDYYVYEAMAYDSIYVNWGLAVPFVGPIINTDRVDNVSQAVSGIEVSAQEAFDRISRPGYATEFTGYMFIDGYNDAVERLGYDTTYEEHGRFVQAFTFADEGCRAEYEGYPDATEIRPGGTGSNKGGYGDANPCFSYNEEDGLYYRSQFGAPHTDEMNGEQLTVSNVVFKICYGEVREPADKDYLAFGVHGQGDAYVFTNGKVIKGTWKRNSDYEPNIFYDENGQEIVFNQGKTWICNIWADYTEYMEWE
ncbi:MAG: DUF3048 domain-containing protein [Lachnospiraceae bacterium]|nr:DUF3048 domain-containing protein [Lachnospiraceae bacterium]